MIFDTLVIGKGLVGSAAAKYLSQVQENSAIIGPDEPDNLAEATLFASHYDSGRVQRQLGRNRPMTLLNLQAVKHYPWLQKESGVQFYTAVGCLYVNPKGKDSYLTEAEQRTAQHGIKAELYENGNALAQAFPDFHFPETAQGMFESAPSGYINPRLLIQAQLNVVEQNGGTVIRAYVNKVENRNGRITVTTSQGNSYQAQKVLLAAGAFTNFSNLLPHKLALTLKSETVILAKVAPEEAQRLAKLPSLLYEIDIPALEGIYAIRPIQYPDGNYYLKMGCNLPEDIFFAENLAEIQHWFRRGNSQAHVAKMRSALMTILPDLKIEECISKRCILTRTKKHGNPYIGRVNEQCFVAIGNGYSAMCSDAIGSLASSLILHGAFPAEYSAEDFELVW